MSKILLSVAVLVALGSGWSSAQQAAAALPVYDVVVIAPNNSGSGRVQSQMDDDTYQARNVTLKFLLVNAYGVRESLMSGLPGWAGTARWDVTAKVTEPDLKLLRGLSREQRQAMLAAVLVERFHLKVHTEVQTLPVYELVVAKGGVKMTASVMPPADPNDAGHPVFGKFNVQGTAMSGREVSMAELVGNLGYAVGRTVVDKTGLTGRYDFELRWTADGAKDAGAEAAPELFGAVEEEMGLKLVSAKGPVETLVLDGVEMPEGN